MRRPGVPLSRHRRDGCEEVNEGVLPVRFFLFLQGGGIYIYFVYPTARGVHCSVLLLAGWNWWRRASLFPEKSHCTVVVV